MALTVFFSWQLDHPARTCRNFIESALQKAVGRLGADIEEAVREEIEVDKDTKGIPGQPPIVDTIFRKIDAAAVFVPDLTFAGMRADGSRPTPNPNVMIEYGWAMHSLSWSRIVPVMNTAYGMPTSETMPFDMAHLRRPLAYCCPEDADAATRKDVKDQLAKDLESALRVVFESKEFRDTLPKPAEPPPFPAASPMDGMGRFRAKGEKIGVVHGHSFLPGSGSEVHLVGESTMWLRVMPASDPGKTWLVTDLEAKATGNPFLLPLVQAYQSYWHLRGEDGFGIFSSLDADPAHATAVAYLFQTGEIWSLDTALLDWCQDNVVPAVEIERRFVEALTNHVGILCKLGLEGPFHWVAGIQGLKGRKMFIPAPPGHISAFPAGPCVNDTVTSDGTFATDDPARTVLQPFFESVFDAFGAKRPQWLSS